MLTKIIQLSPQCIIIWYIVVHNNETSYNAFATDIGQIGKFVCVLVVSLELGEFVALKCKALERRVRV